MKELARQTASATEDIRRRIDLIQTTTGQTVESVRSISEIIGQVNVVSRSIASTVEEQSTAAKEISRNVSQTSEAVRSVAISVAESALATKEISRNTVGVQNVVQAMSHGAEAAQVASNQVSTVTEHLRSSANRFQVDEDNTSLSCTHISA